LTDENIKTDDVTEKFFDIDSRLRLIRYEESRLEYLISNHVIHFINFIK